MALITCPKCGKEISDRANACIYCSHPIQSTTQPIKHTSPKYLSNTQRENKNKKRLLRICLLLIFTVLLIVIIGLINKNPSDSHKPIPTTVPLENIDAADTANPKPAELSPDDAKKLIEELIIDFSVIPDKILYNFEYWDSHDFATIDDIRAFENLWDDVAKDAMKLYARIKKNTPPSQYQDDWNELGQYLKNIYEILESASDMDTNNDGVYNGTEAADLLRSTQSAFSEISYPTVALMEALLTDLSETNNIPTTESRKNIHYCIECGKEANRTYSNPFSGETENYCAKHYQEIIDIMSMMEDDVGSSKQSKHSCEQCSREGTHRYESFTGQIEYYCTQHYEELKDLLEAFGLN